MSRAEPGAKVPRRGADGPLALGVLAAVVATMVPLLRVVESGPWVVGAAVLAASVLAAGYAARWLLRSAIAATLAGGAVWVALLTATTFGATSIAVVVPSGATLREARALVAAAAEQIQTGVAPLVAGRSLGFVIVAGVGALALVLDHVVLTARMPLLAAVALVAVWLIPALAVPAPVDVVSFVFLAATILYVIRAETRSREASARHGARTVLSFRAARGVAAVSAAIAVVAIAAAVAVTPGLPQPAGAGVGIGFGTSLEPSLELGDDLRRPRAVAVLSMRTDAAALPYLRVVTLSRFDGTVWEPDRTATVPLEDGALPEVRAADGVEVVEQHTSVDIAYLSSAWLPVPFPAVAVEGLDGTWRAMAAGRTVVGSDGATRGQSYRVTTHEPRPTLEQIRAASASDVAAPDDLLAVPADLPPIVADTAAAVTAGTGSDYDALIALQTWFRGPEFAYSLDAPVAEGFDGSGSEAVAAFLQVREGYCVHFASAFALMARTLGMPARIVVGYLPGEPTEEHIDGETIALVTSDLSHAWPEVYFDGIGWVAFEPTKSLGTPTAFAAASDTAGVDDPDAATATPTPTASAADPGQSERPDTDPDGAAVGAARQSPLPAIVTALAGLALLLLPGVAAAVRRWRQRVLARRGRIGAAWRVVQDAAIDVGLDLPASETPRALGARLVAAHGAPEAPMTTLVAAIERASYAPPDAGPSAGPAADAAAGDAATVRSAMLAVLPASARLRALLLPRSLVVRPGSAPAEPAGPAGHAGR
ncbi:transglutaminase TgpA family protein [Microbacterium sp.]|uniref:transglutaminase TgpA family protein n=1 Tax=Microbacterium sp. TaxID=51671 RepID=UPI0039E50D46